MGQKTELKPCPFCGGPVYSKNQNPVGNSIIKFFYCDNEACGAVVSFRRATYKTEPFWNARAENQAGSVKA